MTDAHRITTVAGLRAIIGDASPATQVKIGQALDEDMRAYIARAPFLVLSTSDPEGNQDVSPKGDQPGFVAVPDEQTLLIPDRKGNRLIFSLQNILAQPRVSVLFLIPGVNETLRVAGRAELTADPALCEQLSARGQAALLAIRVAVEECYFHCAKAFLRASLWQPDAWPEPVKVSFGRMWTRKVGGDAEVAEQIDAMIAEGYRTEL